MSLRDVTHAPKDSRLFIEMREPPGRPDWDYSQRHAFENVQLGNLLAQTACRIRWSSTVRWACHPSRTGAISPSHTGSVGA